MIRSRKASMWVGAGLAALFLAMGGCGVGQDKDKKGQNSDQSQTSNNDGASNLGNDNNSSGVQLPAKCGDLSKDKCTNEFFKKICQLDGDSCVEIVGGNNGGCKIKKTLDLVKYCTNLMGTGAQAECEAQVNGQQVCGFTAANVTSGKCERIPAVPAGFGDLCAEIGKLNTGNQNIDNCNGAKLRSPLNSTISRTCSWPLVGAKCEAYTDGFLKTLNATGPDGVNVFCNKIFTEGLKAGGGYEDEGAKRNFSNQLICAIHGSVAATEAGGNNQFQRPLCHYIPAKTTPKKCAPAAWTKNPCEGLSESDCGVAANKTKDLCEFVQ